MSRIFKRLTTLLVLPTTALFFISSGDKKDEGRCFAFDQTMAAQLGQHLVVGLPGTSLDEKSEAILRRIRPAGIVLYSRNYKSIEHLKGLVNKLQAIGKEETGLPYFIMIDEEPQGATRVGLLKSVFILGLPDWQKIERSAKVLSDIGINVDLAPLADYPYNSNSFVRRRISADTEGNLVQFNSTFINVLRSYGISSTLKHFPGLGVLEDDPHKKIPHSYISEELFRRSVRIFQDGVESGSDFVMTGHAVYENIDPGNPATFSSFIVKDLLKNQLKFKGLVITDDLSDMPLRNYNGLDTAGAVMLSIKAGHHLVILSHNLQRTGKIYDDVLSRLANDEALQAVVSENYSAIMMFKKKVLEKSRVKAQ